MRQALRTLLLLSLTGLGEAFRPPPTLSVVRRGHRRRLHEIVLSDGPQNEGRRALLQPFASALGGTGGIKVGDDIVAGSDWNSSSPAYGIVRAQAYELRRVYYQFVSEGEVRRVDVDSLDSPPPAGAAGATKYMVLFSERYHAKTAPVILRPDEVQIVRMRDELADSAWLAIPGLFWVWLAYTFYSYGESKGGAFRGLDARSPERRPDEKWEKYKENLGRAGSELGL